MRLRFACAARGTSLTTKGTIMITLLTLVLLGVAGVVSQLNKALEAKRLADARRRESMSRVKENWHFRQWERDFRSSDSV